MQVKYSQSLLGNRINKLSDLKLKIDELNIRLTHGVNSMVSLKRSEVKSAERIVLSSPPSNMIRIKRQRLTHLTNNISGHLVQARGDDGWSWSSSLTRTDAGAHACELVRAEELVIHD